MGRKDERKCIHCAQEFIPDARNARHQRYCGSVLCKAESKRANQAKWLAKSENKDYHRGPEAVVRVQAWRAVHPGYSRHQPERLAADGGQGISPLDVVSSAPTLAEQMDTAKTSCNAPEGVSASRRAGRWMTALPAGADAQRLENFASSAAGHGRKGEFPSVSMSCRSPRWQFPPKTQMCIRDR